MELLTCVLFLLMTLISWSVCHGKTVITAEPGENITLPCKGSENNPVTALKLTRPDLDPEYVLVYRDDRIDERIQHPRFKGRIELQSFSSSDGNVSVILHNVTENDGGTYVCRVRCDTIGAKTRRKRATSERIIHLNVAPPPPGESVYLCMRTSSSFLVLDVRTSSDQEVPADVDETLEEAAGLRSVDDVLQSSPT